MGLFGGGHSGNSTGRGAGESNKEIIARLDADIRQFAGSFGIGLAQPQIDEIINTIFPNASRFNNQDPGAVASYDYDREAIYQKARDFIVPNLMRIKGETGENPSITDQNKLDVTQTFQDVYGRPPTAREIDFFGKELAGGETPYELEQFLRNSQEFLDKKASTDRESLNTQLQAQQKQIFERATPQIISSYLKAGRLNSSGLDNAMARAQAEIDQERQNYLLNVGVNDTVANRAAGFQSYLRNSEPKYQQRLAASQNQNYLNFQAPFDILGRQDQRDYYNAQRNDYFGALDQQYSQQKKLLPYQLFGQLGAAGIQALGMRR